MRIAVFLPVLLALPAAASAQGTDRLRLVAACQPTPEALVYRCIVDLRSAKTGRPLERAAASIELAGAAAGVDPVPSLKAEPNGIPGQYHAVVRVERLGDWALKVKLEAPFADQAVEYLKFQEHGTAPGQPPRASPTRQTQSRR